MSMTATAGPALRDGCARRARRNCTSLGSRLLTFRTAREPPRRGFFERLATARQTWIRHEVLVQIERLVAFRGLHTCRRTIRQQLPALLIVLQVGDHDLVQNLL